MLPAYDTVVLGVMDGAFIFSPVAWFSALRPA